MDYRQFQIVEDMSEVTHIFKSIFDGKKSYGTENVKMGFFHDEILAAKVEGNQILFSLPFDSSHVGELKEILETSHYNKTNSIMVVCDIKDSLLTATFYSKEYRLFL